MPTRDKIYWKFGVVFEAAQILEDELRTMLLARKLKDAGFNKLPDIEEWKEKYEKIKKMTFGVLLNHLHGIEKLNDALYQLLRNAKDSRNRLTHRFHMDHNFRHNSDEGRAKMLRDLKAIHDILTEAHEALLDYDGVDLEKHYARYSNNPLPTDHLQL